MLGWTAGFVFRCVRNHAFMYSALAVASLNMLVHIGFDMAFGSKIFTKLGGWFK